MITIKLSDKKSQKSVILQAPEFNDKNANLDLNISFENNEKFNYRDIKTFEDACERTGKDPKDLPVKYGKFAVLSYMLSIITEAINDGWIPDYSNSDKYKYYPYFIWNKFSGFSFYSSDFTHSASGVGSLLLFESKEKCEYVAKQFIDIYNEYLNCKK
jgi:hypothetical protein